MAKQLLNSLLVLCFSTHGVQAQTSSSAPCSTTISPKYAAPSLAPGWEAMVVASGLTKPRGIIFDSNGHLLLVQEGHGISSLELRDNGGACVRARKLTDVIADNLNHGIELSTDGKTLYASSSEAVYAYDYDSSGARNTSAGRVVVNGMKHGGHTSRTLLISREVDGLLLVSEGSEGNLDKAATDITTGHSQIKAFNMTNVTSVPYDYAKDGLRLGWGLRNSVGVAEEPLTGAIYSVENSADEITRSGQNIHQDNPGEELNFHGYLNGTESNKQGRNYGYPQCYAVWNASTIPNNVNLKVGMQFAIGEQETTTGETVNDTICQNERVAPRLTFAAHMAPLDIKFNPSGTMAWITFHGSWDRSEPIGYKLSVVNFANGSPTEPANSSQAAIDIMSNSDISKCPNSCFRPVGLAWDSKGRLFMSSDATGEIYLISKSDGSPASSALLSTGLLPSNTGIVGAPSAMGSKGTAPEFAGPQKPWAMVIAAVMALPFA
ncbi:soluble quino protein glucose dehydrogenase [Delitschia confertaspora ATCC 74209]|uniref:Soluble quino protein glucose dehydrogenase n=1 Tax=Delitschia confertaspora ATCC 74209 TaxID=1513339 RepID=A0A9P4JGL0_9PLEO|nr:soluble quino protein glucose dehydrogenase [Delitschia confertaspora ATCC 74209]